MLLMIYFYSMRHFSGPSRVIYSHASLWACVCDTGSMPFKLQCNLPARSPAGRVPAATSETIAFESGTSQGSNADSYIQVYVSIFGYIYTCSFLRSRFGSSRFEKLGWIACRRTYFSTAFLSLPLLFRAIVDRGMRCADHCALYIKSLVSLAH